MRNPLTRESQRRGLAYLVGLFLIIPVIGDAFALYYLGAPLVGATIAVSRRKVVDLLILVGLAFMFSFGVLILFFGLRSLEPQKVVGNILGFILLTIRYAIITEGYLWFCRRLGRSIEEVEAEAPAT